MSAVMDKKLRAKWIRALRSGKYRKATGSLEKISVRSGKTLGNCCLGVLCRITKQRALKPVKFNDGRYNDSLCFIRAGNDSFLPEATAKRLGLTRKMQELLAQMNDGGIKQKGGRPHNFKSIADFIKVRLKAA